MGSYFSYKTNDDRNELQNIIEKQNKLIMEQQCTIQLLRAKNNADHCIKNGIVQKVDQNIIDVINNVKANKDYEYLVFSGGGIKGMAFCGTLEILSHDHIMSNIKGFAGTSAGSIVASLLAVGYSYSELRNIMFNMDTHKFLDDKWGFIRDSVNFIEDYGVAKGQYLYDFIGDLIKAKTNDPDYTFDQLYRDKGIKLVVVGTDMNHLCTVYYYPNHHDEQYRNMSIREAVRISTSVPFLYEPVHFKNNLCVDGGVLDNYPLHVFDGEYPGDPKARLNLIPPNPKVLGLNIFTNEHLENYTLTKRQDIDNIVAYLTSFIHLVFNENSRRIMTPSYWIRTINIVTENYPVTQFSLTDKQKQDLFLAGQRDTDEFFSIT